MPKYEDVSPFEMVQADNPGVQRVEECPECGEDLAKMGYEEASAHLSKHEEYQGGETGVSAPTTSPTMSMTSAPNQPTATTLSYGEEDKPKDSEIEGADPIDFPHVPKEKGLEREKEKDILDGTQKMNKKAKPTDSILDSAPVKHPTQPDKNKSELKEILDKLSALTDAVEKLIDEDENAPKEALKAPSEPKMKPPMEPSPWSLGPPKSLPTPKKVPTNTPYGSFPNEDSDKELPLKKSDIDVIVDKEGDETPEILDKVLGEEEDTVCPECGAKSPHAGDTFEHMVKEHPDFQYHIKQDCAELCPICHECLDNLSEVARQAHIESHDSDDDNIAYLSRDEEECGCGCGHSKESDCGPECDCQKEKSEEDKDCHKSPPKGYPKKRSEYLDSKCYKYPVDTHEHTRAALSYLSKSANSGEYSESELKSMWSKLRKAAKKFGIEVSDSDGKKEEDDDASFYEEMAKCEECMEEEEKYPWSKCIDDQMKEYHNKETAEKVCGSIRAKHHHENHGKFEEELSSSGGEGFKPSGTVFSGSPFEMQLANKGDHWELSLLPKSKKLAEDSNDPGRIIESDTLDIQDSLSPADKHEDTIEEIYRIPIDEGITGQVGAYFDEADDLREEIQVLIFDKGHFPNAEDAEEWLSENGDMGTIEDQHTASLFNSNNTAILAQCHHSKRLINLGSVLILSCTKSKKPVVVKILHGDSIFKPKMLHEAAKEVRRFVKAGLVSSPYIKNFGSTFR